MGNHVTANLAALAAYGVEAGPRTDEVAALAHVTPELIRAWGEHLRARATVRNLPGLLLHVLRVNAGPPPEPDGDAPRPCRPPASPDLPAELLEALAALGFRGARSLQEVVEAFAEDAERVRGWVTHVAARRDLRNPPGFLLEMLRSGAPPPPPPADPRDPRRYISGAYADLIEH